MPASSPDLSTPPVPRAVDSLLNNSLQAMPPLGSQHMRKKWAARALRVTSLSAAAAALYNALHTHHAGSRGRWRQELVEVESKKAVAPKPAQRIIKKYPNRRLYDTDTSSYITLAQVKQLVLEAQPFIVRDAKTNDDLTRAILLQIILEEEAGGAPMFSEQALANIIRFYGHAMQGFMGSYLEKNVQAFTDMQTKLAEQSKTLTPEMWAQFGNVPNPMIQGGLLGNYLEQSKSIFEKMTEQMNKQTEQMLGAFTPKR